MKARLIIFFILFSAKSFCQNEFAASSFYNAVNKLQEDGRNGFPTYKGVRLKSDFEEMNDEFKAIILLPLADSGKIVVPETGNPYAIYFFETEKRKQHVDERALNLREAILTAYAKPLYAKTISTNVNNKIFSDTYLYAEENEMHTSRALMLINVFYKNDRYHLTLRIHGMRQDPK